ncbi:MAG: hypothetical protein ABR584_06410 [Candidatus Baltobacteraceae bacterium]
MSASTLTGIFAPGSPALLESLRTLVITPTRFVDPCSVIRADFTFSNVGGAAATGVRARFALPAGVEPVPGSDTIDDVPLRNGESFIAINGATVGDLESNGSRRISISYRVIDVIEDGTGLAFQAALVSDQLAVTASNIERLTVRSKPVLQNPTTLVQLIAPDEPKPGDQITIRATLLNSGPSSAHDVVAILPLPEHTTYVPRTARIAGRPIPDGEGEPFDYDSGTLVAARLAPSQSVIVEYQAQIESPLEDGTRINVCGSIASRDLPEFALSSSEIVVRSPIDFANDETGLTVFSDDSVTPGTRIAMSVRASNSGTGPAQGVSVHYDLPDGLIYTPGSAMIDGQPIGDDAFAGETISIGTVAPERSIEIGLSAMVGVPPEGDHPLPIVAHLRWRGGERQFERRLSVRATPRFARARNYIEVERRVAQAEEDVDFLIHLLNDGTAADRNLQLRILPGAFLGVLRIIDGAGVEIPYDAPVNLESMEPHLERVITVRAKIVPPVPDRSTVTLGAVLEQHERTIDLGVGSIVVRSRAHVAPQSAGWEMQSRDQLRPGTSADVIIRFTNDGSDTLRDAHAVLQLPKELAIERAHDARREHNTLYFGDVAAKTTHEARVTMRLLRARSGEHRLALEGTLYGRGMSAIALSALEVPTFALPEFEAGAQLRSSPYEVVNAGERIAYDLFVRNTGDGPADQLIVRAVPSNLAAYVPGSTTVNGRIVSDDVGTSALWSQRGLVLTEIDPSIEVRVHWEMMAVAPLAAGTPIDARVVLNWDAERSHALAAPTLHVQSAPSLAGDISVATISIAETIAKAPSDQSASWQAAPQARPAPPSPAPLPTAITEMFERAETAQPSQPEPLTAQPLLEPASASDERLPARDEPAESIKAEAAQHVDELQAPGMPVAFVDFGQEKLSRTLRMLEKSDLDGMLPHLFAIRTFFPESAVNATPDLEKSFRVSNRAMQNALDRLFVRLRIPRYSLTAKDLEDRDSRFALRQLVSTIVAAEARPGGDGRAPGVVRISGPLDTRYLRTLQPQLESAPLGSAVPWQVAAAMLGTTIHRDDDESSLLGAYRDELISVLGTLSTLPLEEFHRVLRDSANRALDDALAGVLETLRSAAHIAAE